MKDAHISLAYCVKCSSSSMRRETRFQVALESSLEPLTCYGVERHTQDIECPEYRNHI